MMKLFPGEDGGDDTSLLYGTCSVRTTQLYGLPHAKIKFKSCLFHKNTGFKIDSYQLQMSTQVVIRQISDQYQSNAG